MRNCNRLSFLVIVCVQGVLAQGPFQFREAYLLEHRIEVTRSGEEYDPTHSELVQSTVGPSPADQFLHIGPTRNCLGPPF
jgi:hypothetical protein